MCIQFSRPSQQSQEPSCNSILDIASGVGVRAYCCHFIELLLHGRYTGFHFSPSGSQHGLSFFVVRLASRSLHGLSFFALNFASNSTYSFIVRRQAGLSVATESCIFLSQAELAELIRACSDPGFRLLLKITCIDAIWQVVL